MNKEYPFRYTYMLTHHHYECLIKQKVLLSSHLGNIYLKFFIIQFLPRKSGGLSEM